MPTTNGCWSGKVANEGTAVWLTTGREAKVELTVMGGLYTVDEQGAENCQHRDNKWNNKKRGRTWQSV